VVRAFGAPFRLPPVNSDVRHHGPDTAMTSYLLIVIVALAGYGAFDLTRRFLVYRSEQRSKLAQDRAEEEEFWNYSAEHHSIRRKFDPGCAWNESTSVPEAFASEIRALNVQHRGMLMRRNGWTEEDFRDSAHDV
jgi:hypothetical protein